MVETISKKNTLVCIFSFNMTRELRLLLNSIKSFLPNFDSIIIDDASTNPLTLKIIQAEKGIFKKIIIQKSIDKIKTRGRLAENIQFAYDYANRAGYKYLFLVQDDMQFVRPMTQALMEQYSALFEYDSSIIEIDPRFLRRLGRIEIEHKIKAYSFPPEDDRRSFADVGILHLERLNALNWVFGKGERPNKVKAHALGLRRIFPFSPIMMHVPYPKVFRKGNEIRPFPWPLVWRGWAYYRKMTDKEIIQMDSRSIEVIPYAKDFLRAKNLLLAKWHYSYGDENRVFS